MDNWILINQKTKLKVNTGDSIMDFYGNETTIKSGIPPHKESATGLVYNADGFGYHPSVFGLKWIPNATTI